MTPRPNTSCGGWQLQPDFLRLDDPLFYHKLCLLVGADLPPLTQTNAQTGGSVHVPAAEVRRILEIYAKDYELLEGKGLK